MYKDINQIDEFNEFIKSNEAALVYFSTPECNVCKVLKPKVLDFLSENFPEIKPAYVDCETMKELAAQIRIFAIPVVIIFFEGKESIRRTRNINLDELNSILNRPYELLFD
ncbi:MAG TPA: thioredoxin family protein [Ignavibacteriaceae bacterium]|nr:thioredoxin family protein [Ignavibacteriaceae bacterium]